MSEAQGQSLRSRLLYQHGITPRRCRRAPRIGDFLWPNARQLIRARRRGSEGEIDPCHHMLYIGERFCTAVDLDVADNDDTYASPTRRCGAVCHARLGWLNICYDARTNHTVQMTTRWGITRTSNVILSKQCLLCTLLWQMHRKSVQPPL